MILKLLLKTQIIWVILIKTVKNTIQIKNEKFYMFGYMHNNEKRNEIVNELFITGRKLNTKHYIKH